MQEYFLYPTFHDVARISSVSVLRMFTAQVKEVLPTPGISVTDYIKVP